MGHWHADLAGGALTGSPQTFSILGLDPTAALPDMRELLNLFHPEDRAQIEQTMREAVAGPAPFEVDGRISRPDGSWRSVVCTGQPETDERGQASALFGVIADVTEAFDAIRSIQDQNEMLGMAADLAHLGHWVWSRDLDRLTFCSDELGRIHELAPGTVIRQFTHPALFAVVVGPNDRDRYRTTVTEALARPRPMTSNTASRRAAAGSKTFARPASQY
ncbi:MAG: PAS domain S-box protein [Rhodospirillaceae bacterium]|nr:PAS domain S-box protein [Rhodospirillaceae bacterium]